MSWCYDTFVADPTKDEGEEFSLMPVLMVSVNVAMSIVVMSWVVWHRRLAQQRPLVNSAVVQAANALILPVYMQILVGLVLTELLIAGGAVLQPSGAASPSRFALAVLSGSMDALQQAVPVLVTFFLLGQSAGSHALKRAGALTLVFVGGAGALLAWAATWDSFFRPCLDGPGCTGAYIKIAYDCVVLTLFATIVALPAAVVFRRPALNAYARFWALVWLLVLAEDVAAAASADWGYCVRAGTAAVLMGVAKPVVIYRALLEDSHYWQGIVVRKSDEPVLNSPLMCAAGTMGQQSASEVAGLMDRLESQLPGVPVLNFAFLHTEGKILGSGGSARVYRGTYKGDPVAIKMVLCMELTRDIVERFCHEAGVLGRLRHPNIVLIEGVCVRPPSVCLVMELCSNGSLTDYLRLHHAALSLEQRLCMAADVARGVAFMHAQTVPVTHRDLKSMNCLVTELLQVKIADLELAQVARARRSRTGSESSGSSSSLHSSTGSGSHRSWWSSSQGGGGLRPETYNWCAPEAIRGGIYTPKSDVYALALVVWEIYTGEVPYADLSGQATSVARQADIAAAVCDRRVRPKIPVDAPVDLAQLLCEAWHHEPAARPGAGEVLDRLLSIRGER